jgi:hypothetical protein
MVVVVAAPVTAEEAGGRQTLYNFCFVIGMLANSGFYYNNHSSRFSYVFSPYC